MTLTMTLTTLLLRGRLKKTKMKKTALRGHRGRRDRCHDDDDIEDDINDDDDIEDDINDDACALFFQRTLFL